MFISMSIGQFYFKSPQEMKILFRELPEVIKNTLKIAGMCDFKMDLKQKPAISEYKVPKGFSPYSYLAGLAGQGLEKRLKKAKKGLSQLYKSRLENELKVIKKWIGHHTSF